MESRLRSRQVCVHRSRTVYSSGAVYTKWLNDYYYYYIIIILHCYYCEHYCS